MLGKMKELMEMKKQADRIKKELDQVTAEVNDINGIRIIINGSQDFKYIEIADSLLNSSNKVKLEKDLLKALNSAIKKSQTMAAEKMRSVLPNFPGM